MTKPGRDFVKFAYKQNILTHSRGICTPKHKKHRNLTLKAVVKVKKVSIFLHLEIVVFKKEEQKLMGHSKIFERSY